MLDTRVIKSAAPQGDYVQVPLTDIYETPDQYTLKMEMPGVVKDRLDITLENNELEIRGETEKYKSEGRERKYSEFTQYDYYRKYDVGDDIDRGGINATFENGVLTLVLQKHEAVKPKKIPVNVK